MFSLNFPHSISILAYPWNRGHKKIQGEKLTESQAIQ